MTKRQDNLIKESLLIEQEDAKEAGTLGFMARAMVQATLPHSDPKTNYFERTNGLVTLSVTSKPGVGVPYGSLPRLLLAWIVTEAKRTKSPELMLGRSQSEFLGKLNMRSEGRTIGTLKDQTKRLLTSMISLSGVRGTEEEFENVVIARRGMLFWNPKQPDQQSLWESTMTLNTDFYESILRSAVPIDLRVLHQLRKSPMAMDIYMWLTWRVYTLHHSRHPIANIPWPRLMAQIGSSYGLKTAKDGLAVTQTIGDDPHAVRNFRMKFLARLREVLLFYPAAQDAITWDSDQLTIRRAKLHIPPALYAVGGQG